MASDTDALQFVGLADFREQSQDVDLHWEQTLNVQLSTLNVQLSTLNAQRSMMFR